MTSVPSPSSPLSNPATPQAAPWTPSRWIVSAPFDLSIVLVPLMLALGALALIKGLGVQEPLWAYLLFFVSFDVAHVWGTIYITYLDPDAMQRRRWLFLLPIPICFILSFGLHLISPTAFWTIVAYVAIYHFAKQQYGFVAIYKARERERDPIDYKLDKLALWTAALGPVLLWHATPRGQFDWFGSGESFLFTLPAWAQGPILAGWLLVGLAYIARQVQVWVRDRRFNLGKNVWMLAAWVSWFIGVRLSEHLFISAAFLNLVHGIPYMALIWRRCNVRWSGGAGEHTTRHKARMARLMVWLSRAKRWFWFYGIVLALAIAEEFLWDGLVWGKYLPDALGMSAPELSKVAMAFWVALLSLPQIVHYFLDGYLWKMDGSNPDLPAALGFKPPPSASAKQP